jgi:phosphoglycolate phosphatase-like HAD superfamily hydrolase
MITDSLFLDQQQAQRTAFLAMIEHISKQLGVPPAEVAHTLLNPSDRLPSPATFRQVHDVLAVYLEKRTQATRPPDGLSEALNATRRRLLAREDGSGEHMVGISALPRGALERYASQVELRWTLDCIYSVGRAEQNAATRRAEAPSSPCIRSLTDITAWPSASAMTAICKLHRAKPEEAMVITGDLGEEIRSARALGMASVYVRLGPANNVTTGMESCGPDAIANRLEDLPRLRIFQSAARTVSRLSVRDTERGA